MVDLEQEIIERVINFRLRMQLSQGAIARIINVSASFVGNVENVKSPAKYSLKHLSLLAAHFKLSPIYFLLSDDDYIKIKPDNNLKSLFPIPKYQLSKAGRSR